MATSCTSDSTSDRASGGGPLPALRVRNGRLIIDQEGRAPFALDGVSLTLKPGKRYQILGVVDEPTWGPIDVSGSLKPASESCPRAPLWFASCLPGTGTASRFEPSPSGPRSASARSTGTSRRNVNSTTQ